MTLDEAIAHVRAMLDRAEDANRESRHAEERVRDAATDARIDGMREAASERFWSAATSALGDAASAGVGFDAGSDDALSPRATAFKEGIAAVSQAITGLTTKMAAESDAKAAGMEALANRAGSAVADRADDMRALDKGRERLTDAFAALERARAEARIAASRG